MSKFSRLRRALCNAKFKICPQNTNFFSNKSYYLFRFLFFFDTKSVDKSVEKSVDKKCRRPNSKKKGLILTNLIASADNKLMGGKCTTWLHNPQIMADMSAGVTGFGVYLSPTRSRVSYLARITISE